MDGWFETSGRRLHVGPKKIFDKKIKNKSNNIFGRYFLEKLAQV